MLLAQTDVYDVLVTLVSVVPATISAVAAVIVVLRIRTPSGTAIGRQVESAHHVALGNNYRLRAMSGELNVTVDPKTTVEEGKAQPPDE